MKTKLFISLFFLIIGLLSNYVFLYSETEFEVYYDYALFRYNDDSSIVEIYYSFNDEILKYNVNDNKFLSNKLIFVAKFTKPGVKSIVGEIIWDYPIYKNQSDSLQIFTFFGTKKITLPGGEYDVQLAVVDPTTKDTLNKQSTKINVNIFPNNDRPQVSGLLLAKKIEKVAEASQKWDDMFRKDQLFVLPNPYLEYRSDDPEINFYFELYNLKENTPQNIAISIVDANKREVSRSFLKLTSKERNFGKNLTYPLDLLPTGVYYLKVELLTENNNVLDVSSKKFYFLSDEIKPKLSMYFTDDQIFEQSEFITMDEKTLEKEIKKARIIGTNEEMSQWEKLTDLKAKQRFLYRFWRDRDSDPSTLINETKVEFDERVKYANTHFNITKDREGWATDRGRVLLKYGYPTYVVSQEARGLNNAYETWKYDEIQGGVEFIFVDQVGIGHYVLVHSTAQGEIYNPNWYDQYILKNKKIGN